MRHAPALLLLALLPVAVACPSTRYRTRALFGSDERALAQESVGKVRDLQARTLAEAEAGHSTARLILDTADASAALADGLEDRAARAASYLRASRAELAGLESVSLAWFGELREQALAATDAGARQRGLDELEARRQRYEDLRAVLEAGDLKLDAACGCLNDLALFAKSMGGDAVQAELAQRLPTLASDLEAARGEQQRGGDFAEAFIGVVRP